MGQKPPQGGQRKVKEGGKAGSMAPVLGSLEYGGEAARVMIWVRTKFWAGLRGNKDRRDGKEVERAVT